MQAFEKTRLQLDRAHLLEVALKIEQRRNALFEKQQKLATQARDIEDKIVHIEQELWS